MAKRPEITVRGFLIKPEFADIDPRDVNKLKPEDMTPIEELTDEQLEQWDRDWKARAEPVITNYYRNHPEYLALLPDAEGEAI